MSKLSHIDEHGRARMVDTAGKHLTERTATATVTVLLNSETYTALRKNKSSKGDVLTVAKIAGIQAAKRTSELIPLCHQIPLHNIDIQFALDDKLLSVTVEAKVKCQWSTGVEMEALTACSVTALTIYDMLKAIQKDIVITDLKLIEKRGGKSGDFIRDER
jgi:cyclic pyranopterin monophosphate synthase